MESSILQKIPVREDHNKFLERYLFTLSPTFVEPVDCAKFLVQKRNRDLQLLVSYLTRFNSYKKYCKFHKLHKVFHLVIDTVSSVRETIANDMEDDDINQCIETAYYISASKFNPERGVPFPNFLYHYYKWTFLGELKKCLWHTPIATIPQITNLFDGTFEENERAELKPIQDNIDVISFSHKEFNSNNVLTNDKIDFNWVGGSTCSWLFESLTELERLVLKKAFVDEMSVRGIAQEMGVTSVIIKSIIEKCKATIQANLEEEELTDE
jgi:hypothetical protein